MGRGGFLLVSVELHLFYEPLEVDVRFWAATVDVVL